MALNISKCNHLMPLRFKGLNTPLYGLSSYYSNSISYRLWTTGVISGAADRYAVVVLV